MAQKIQIRRDTAANWVTANPVLAQGEPGHEIDTGKVKFGNGIDNWNSLIYQDLTGSSWTQTGSGAVTRTVDEKLKDVVSVKDFGAVGDGVANDTAAITAAIAAHGYIFFPAGTYRVLSNLTIASSKVIEFHPQASLDVEAGATVTIYARFIANPDSHVFKGAGSVVGIGEVYPEWWGAIGNKTNDDQPAFQKAVTCVQSHAPSSGNGVIHLQSKQYLLGSTWYIYESANAPIDVIGTGTLIGDTRLYGTASFTGTLVSIEGANDPVQSTVDYNIKGFAIISQNVARGIGLAFNSLGSNYLQGLQESLVENIYVDGFSTGILVRRTRLVNFRRISVWNERIDGTLFANANFCVQIKDGPDGTSSFCGDLTWDNCQFVTKKQFWSEVLRIEAASSPSTSKITMAGIRFNQCIFYRGGDRSIKIITKNFSQMADVWFTCCQFDDTKGLLIQTLSANSRIVNINIHQNYYTATENFVKINSSASPGEINAIGISDNYGAGSTKAAVDAVGAHNLVITNNRFTGCGWTIGHVILLVDCSQVVVNGNNAGRAGPALAGGFTNLVRLAGTGDYYVVTGNNSAGLATGTLISDVTGATNVAIANNI
jgi:hypothetical protein